MFIKNFDSINSKDLALVGGKNASLGEMIQHLTPLGIKIPTGFVINVDGYKAHLKKSNLEPQIKALLEKADKNDLKQFAKIGKEIRDPITTAVIAEATIATGGTC